MKHNPTKFVISIVAICWSFIQVYNALTFELDIFQLQVLHIMFALMLVFLLKPSSEKIQKRFIADYFLVLLSFVSCIYFFLNYERIITRIRFASPVLPGDIFFGSILIILILEAGRRIVGVGLSVLGAISVLYVFLGFLIPGPLAHRSVNLYNFMEFMVLTQEGVFGIPLRVSATYVFLFILFGAFLRYGRLGEFYSELATSIAGGLRGGPAKVAVVSSGLLGTISGSAVANVSTSGTFTIPMMIKANYRPTSAAAIEALASTGSQIVPPIMGAAAFIMAELTGISYWKIVVSAIIPAVLYYISVYAVVHFEAIKFNIEILSEDRKPFLSLMTKKCYMFIPVFVIIYLLATGHTISLSAIIAIFSCFIISSIHLILTGKWNQFDIFLKAMEDGAKSAISVAIPCAIAGIIVGVLTLTALGLKFTSLILDVTGGNIWWLLIMTSLICLILGMGMPTSAAYITVAILAIPALIKGGVPTLSAHFFGFYFANLSMITPPVALAAYAAAGIAKVNSTDVGLKACFLGLSLYAIPMLFASYPSLTLIGSWSRIGFEFIKATLIIISICSLYMGVFIRKTNLLEKGLFLLTVASLWVSRDMISLNLLGIVAFGSALMSNLKIGPIFKSKPKRIQ